jgi:hypothetical protein
MLNSPFVRSCLTSQRPLFPGGADPWRTITLSLGSPACINRPTDPRYPTSLDRLGRGGDAGVFSTLLLMVSRVARNVNFEASMADQNVGKSGFRNDAATVRELAFSLTFRENPDND